MTEETRDLLRCTCMVAALFFLCLVGVFAIGMSEEGLSGERSTELVKYIVTFGILSLIFSIATLWRMPGDFPPTATGERDA